MSAPDITAPERRSTVAPVREPPPAEAPPKDRPRRAPPSCGGGEPSSGAWRAQSADGAPRVDAWRRSGWRPESRPGLAVVVPFPALLLVLLAGATLWLTITQQAQRNRVMEAEVSRLSAEVAHGRQRERAMEAAIAAQHRRIRASQGDLDALRLHVEAIELQLDGVDYLSRQVREELGLPAGSGTWQGPGVDVPGQGGAYVPMNPDRQRVALARHRLANGLDELLGLLQLARQRRADASSAAEPPRVALPDRPPANWPARGVVTSDFGWRLFHGLPNYHGGVDIGLPYNSQVLATGQGIVVGSGWQPGYGLCVLIQHGGGYSTLYAHLADSVVQLGAMVRPGALIGYSGSSGNSTGPHLHYEVWRAGRPVDPRPYMDGTGSE
jgi:hypothetical protein